MSDMPGTSSGPGSGAGGGMGHGPGDARRRRTASVTLREGGGERVQSVTELMDPANKSLADALRIAYRLLLGSIFVMIVLFMFSGIQKVETSEAGVRVTLGKIVERNLAKGLKFSWPSPFGEVLKVKTTEETVDVKRAFYPSLSKSEEDMLNDESKGTQALAEGGRDFLDPDSDGALLTADGYMVHARWQVTYRRKSDGAHITLEQIASDPEEEKDRESTERLIVAAAVRQAVVHAAAQMTVDEVLYDQTTPERRDKFRLIKSIAQAEAQHILDKMDLGIELQQFEPSKRIPPRFVIRSFNDVQSAQSRAGADRSKAQEEAAKRLAEAAGEGAPMILAQIDVYETQLAAGKADDAAATLQRIQDLMQRRTVSIDGKDVLATVSGDVSKRLSEAVQYQTSVVSRARSDASAYDAKLGAFRANPQVYLSGEWTAAYTKFASAETLQTMLLPPGLERLVLRINKDPEVDKRVKMMLAEQETMDAARDREKKRANEVHERRLEGTSLEGS